MKSILAALLCVGALGAAGAPALAQPRAVSPAFVPGRDFREQLQTLRDRLDTGVRDRTIDRGEFDRATREMDRIKQDMRDRRWDGMSERDRMAVQRRIDDLARSIHWMRETGRPPMPLPPAPGPAPGAMTLEQREDWLQRRIDRGQSDGTLSRGEAWRIQRMLSEIRSDQSHMMRRDGGILAPRDRELLEGRLNRLRDTLRSARDADRAPW